MDTANAIKNIYAEREKFIIIGLTGRTGSGCTTVSDILKQKEFKNLSLHKPKTTNFASNEERKYQIIYNYAQKHWDGFASIDFTDIIFSFVLEKSYKDFENIYNGIFPKQENDESLQFPKLENIFNAAKTLSEQIIFLVDGKKDGSLNLDKFNEKIESEDKTTVSKKINYQDILKDLGELRKKVAKEFGTFSFERKSDTNKSDTEIINGYTYFLQELGNRIRHHGSIDENIDENNENNEKKNFSGEHMYALARRANSFIKAIRRNGDNNGQTLVCLDAIRNPYEATYFQDRYSAFFLVAVSTDDKERVRRLGKYFSYEQIKALDNKEYPQKLNNKEKFTNQNIGACMQLADIYLYNPYEATKEKFVITEAIVKYVTLMKHPGLISPSSVERCMQMAYNAKLNSGCLSRQVGAVITDSNYSIKAVGWNTVAEGQVPCNLRNAENFLINKDEGSFSTFELEDREFGEHMKKYSEKINCESLDGRLCSYCFKDEYAEITGDKNQVHTRSLHAEENAFLQIVKYGGEGIKGGKLFTSASSCVLCSKKAFQLGIKDIYYIDPYPDIATTHILSFGKDKSKCPQCHLFYGAIGRAYTCLFTQRIPIKDELGCLYDKSKEAKN